MNRHPLRRLVWAFLLLLAGSAAAAPLASTARLGYEGMGQAKIGMGFFDLLDAVGRRLTIDPGASEGCTYTWPADLDGVAFMLIDTRVARIDVGKPPYLTISGAKVGDTEETVLRLYRGRARVLPHKYTDGHYIEVRSADGRSALVFETDGKVVTAYRVGRLPEVLWVEGCS